MGIDLLVELLLSLSLLVLSIARGLLGLVTSDGANNSILLSGDTVTDALDPALSLSGLVLGLAFSVTLGTVLGSVVGTDEVAECFLDVAEDGVGLARSLGVVASGRHGNDKSYKSIG